MNRFKHAKRTIILFGSSLLVVILSLYLFGDLIAYSDDEHMAMWLMMKWTIVISATLIIIFSIQKIISTFTTPFGKDQKVIDIRKSALLAKPTLLSKSDRIVQQHKSVNL